jgi:large subunit ribosomal protein L32
MANPKRRNTRTRRDKRRTHKKLAPPGLSVCPQCHELKLPHYTCLNCGTYKGKAVIAVEEA